MVPMNGSLRPVARAIASGLTLACAAALATGCHSLPERPAAARGSQAAGGVGTTAILHVASNGWHTSIVIPRRALPPGAIPEAADFPEAQWLGFGWGDAVYFPAPEASLGMMLRAALLPTDAVIQMSGLPGPVRETYPTAEIVALEIPGQAMRGAVAYIDASFARSGGRRARPVAEGREPFSQFYPATGRFHIFSTCNTWAAQALASAGLPVQVTGTITAENLMAQIRGFARRTQAPQENVTRPARPQTGFRRDGAAM